MKIAVFVVLGLGLQAAIALGAGQTTLEIGPRNAQLLHRLERYPDLEVLSISCIDHSDEPGISPQGRGNQIELEELRALPDSIGKLTKLRELIINNGNGCAMNPMLPEALGNLRALEKLVLYGAQDPQQMKDEKTLRPPQRHSFPGSMSQLKNLRYLDLGRNGLNKIPSFVQDLPKLQELHFEFNLELLEVPSFVANLRELKVLNLEKNDLQDLPAFLNLLPMLTQVYLGNNCKITQNESKKKELQKRFPKIHFSFEDEFWCPGAVNH